MKKGIFSSLILTACLLATSMANASQINSVNFEQQYSNLYAYLLEWFSTAKVSTTIATYTLENATVGETAVEHPKYTKLLKKNNARINCLKTFNNSKNLTLETQALVKKLSPEDLQFLDNYYKGELGKKEIDFGKRLTEVTFNGDMKAQLAFLKLNDNEKFQVASQKILDYEKQHKEVFERYHKTLMSPEVTKIEDNFIQSCKF